MKFKVGTLILAFVLLALFGCGEKPAGSQSSSRLLMGTLMTITLWSQEGETSRSAAAMQSAFGEMERIEKVMSSHLNTSAVGRINQAPRGQWHPLEEEVYHVLAESLRIAKLSQGAFEAGLWPLTNLWGFSREPPATAPPEMAKIESWRKGYPLGTAIQIRGETGGRQILLANEYVGLDLGAIAKGYAVDRALDHLAVLGFTNAIVNAGGNLGVNGSKGGTPWRIGIQHPRESQGVVAEVSLQKRMGLVTSGDYERFFMHEGKRYHHILDPQSGMPTANGVVSVTIQHPKAMTADALSTAAFVLGLDKGLELIRQEPGASALFILEDGRQVASGGFSYRWLGGGQ
ncbi:MAG: FAD:protein FMN transferase [Magnetococcales bacterium]|nr:FAD:protein FMN transferase [Magnetococcales bacterium]NGZ26627.1 FAD:protein FMN transferase [Magnetococcales bacterium]